ncbi:ABC transporter [Candidatus Saccharibacteria bacterium]|nr:MAG: ABC transporter [Candidatus Saccharibacteria bacterium]
MAKKRKITIKQYLSAVLRVMRHSFGLAPSSAIFKAMDSIIQAILPIATTYFAALTTTFLVEAYSGAEGASEKAILYVMLTSVFGVFSLVWSGATSVISQKTRYTINSAIEDEMILQLSRLPFEMYDDKETIDLYDKAKRFSHFFGYVFNTIGDIFSSFIGAIGSIVALSLITPYLSFIILLAVLPGLIIQMRLTHKQIQHWEGSLVTRRRRFHIGKLLMESRKMSEMRVYGVAKYLVGLFKELRDIEKKEDIRIEIKSTWQRSLADIIGALVELGALIWIALQIIDRAQPVGQFVYVQQLVSRALAQMGNLADRMASIDEDLANLVDYHKFMELPTVDDSGHELQKAPEEISLKSVYFTYPKTKKQVLKDISIDIKRGDHVAIVGENGAGKSTLIKLIMGLYKPTDGDIYVDRQKLSDVNQESWHKRIALLGQEFIIYEACNLRENITLGDVSKEPTDHLVDRAVEAAELGEVIDDLERGDKTYVQRWMADETSDTKATELSGGQYQRLALARNFYRDAPIVILDEPTSAIDALAESRIFDRLFVSKKTIIAISHRLSTIEKADVVYMMKNGAIVESGKASRLIEQRGEFYKMFSSQIKKP